MFKQEIGIPMGKDSAPYWANLFLYFFKSKYVQQLISKYLNDLHVLVKFHGTSRFIDDLCTINGDEFSSSQKYIYPKQLELKLEHQGKHVPFLDLDITIEDNIFAYRFFDKRDKLPCFSIYMPYLSRNIPSSILYGSIFSEFLRIARCTLRLTNFEPKAFQLYTRMVTQGGNKASILRQIKKAFQIHHKTFSKYRKTYDEIINGI